MRLGAQQTLTIFHRRLLGRISRAEVCASMHVYTSTSQAAGGPDELAATAIEALTPLEREQSKGFSDKRLREFALGRLLARRCLQDAGAQSSSREGIGIGPDRGPQWPDGIVGSISHCPGALAAIVGHNASLAGIGIDVEAQQKLDPGIVGAVLRSDESHDDALVKFSAKESLYKLWAPIMGQWLDFSEASVRLVESSEQLSGHRAGDIEYTLHTEEPTPEVFSRVKGLWLAGPDLVATAAWINA